jgi:hypothetical protein
MKYKVGDLILVKKCYYETRILLHLHPPLRLHPPLHPPLHPHLHNTIGIITEVEKHSDIFEKDSTENDNGYIWYSQVDGREYYFYQDEVDGEVIS